MEIKSLSLVIPSYKQEKTIVSEVRSLQKSLSSLPYALEIIVVLDGEVDNSLQKLKKANIQNVKIVSYKKNQGKGYAVRKGMLETKGNIVGFIDSGGDIDLSVIPIALHYMTFQNADILIGSKLHPDSQVNYPLIRRILSLGFRSLTKILLNLGVKDTQVGVKFFRGNVARDIFPRLLVKKFAFDVEMLAVAKVLGYDRIFEIPIKLNFKPGTITKTNFWKASLHMLWDTLAVFYRVRILRYYRKSNRKNWLKV